MKLYRNTSNKRLYYIEQNEEGGWDAIPYFRSRSVPTLIAKPKTYKDGSTRFEGYIEVYDARRG